MTAGPSVALPPGASRAAADLALSQRLARYDYLEFVRLTKSNYTVDPVHAFVAAKLQAFVEAIERGESPRLMLFMPPQEGKSELSSRRLPPWILGRHPDWRVVLVSYGADWAEDLSAAARRVVSSDAYAAIFPSTKIDPKSTAVSDWHVLGHDDGGMRALGVGGAITGKSAEILILDDPVKGRNEVDTDTYRQAQKNWWPQAVDRVQEPGGIIVLCTRWHHDDLPGHLLQMAKDNPLADQWEVISLPALAEPNDPLGRAEGEPLAPSRHTLGKLLNLQANMPPRDWIAKFQQRPTPEEGALFKRDWFPIEPVPDKPGFILHAWDTAFSEKTSADFSVGLVIRIEGNAYRILDRHRERLPYPALKQRVKDAATGRHRARAVLVEDIGSGKSLVQELRASTRLPIVTYRPDRDKVSRAHAVTGICAARRVILPQGAPWLEDFFDELLRFPAAEHDDQVDALTMALTFAETLPFRAFESRDPSYADFTWDRRELDDDSGLYADLGLAAPAAA